MNHILLLSRDHVFSHNLKEHLPYELHTIDQFEIAYEVLELHSVMMAIVDEQHSDSERLLTFLNENYPKVIRLSILDAGESKNRIQMNHYRFAQLTWHKQQSIFELVNMVEKLIKLDTKVNNREIINLVSSLKNLPTLPKIYFELTKLIEKNAPVDLISDCLEEDPAVATNILKLANSAFYNAKTGSINQAIMYIGLNNVKNIILTNAVFGSDKLDDAFREKHWRHVSFANKFLNGMYINVFGKKMNNNISAVGLLHDIGNIVLMCNFPNLLHDLIIESKRSADKDLLMIEKNQIGFSHEELGGHLLDLWGLPLPIVEVALYHHDPLLAGVMNTELVTAMHIADYYAWHYVGASEDEMTLNPKVFDLIDIPKTVFDDYYKKFLIEAETTAT